MGNHNQEARCLQADSDTRKSMLAGPRSEEVGFAHDSALVEAVTSELVSETTISGLLECGWGLSDR